MIILTVFFEYRRFLMKQITSYFVLATGLLNALPEHLPHDHPASDSIEQCAAYIAEQSDHATKEHRRNRLQDDPEQQDQYMHDIFVSLNVQLGKIEKELEQENRPEKLDTLEKACRIIVQAFLYNHRQGNNAALSQAEVCTFHVVARIKLMQDPFWSTIISDILRKKIALTPPVYATQEIDVHLQADESKKDRLIKQLLKQLEELSHQQVDAPQEAFDELNHALRPYKKSKKELINLFLKLDTEHEITRVKDVPPKAVKLYNGAVTSEIQAQAQFFHLKDKHQYPQLEQAYGSVALLYLKAYDAGHPKGLEEAEKIMNSGVIDTILTWKTRHRIAMPYAYIANIWEQINKRKHRQQDGSGAASSGT